MEIRWHILWLIIGTALVTFLPRVIPLAVLSRLQLPEWVLRWLKHVPIAIMAALVGQELFTENGEAEFLTNKAELLAAVFTFAAAIMTRSLLATVLVGILCIFTLRLII